MKQSLLKASTLTTLCLAALLNSNAVFAESADHKSSNTSHESVLLAGNHPDNPEANIIFLRDENAKNKQGESWARSQLVLVDGEKNRDIARPIWDGMYFGMHRVGEKTSSSGKEIALVLRKSKSASPKDASRYLENGSLDFMLRIDSFGSHSSMDFGFQMATAEATSNTINLSDLVDLDTIITGDGTSPGQAFPVSIPLNCLFNNENKDLVKELDVGLRVFPTRTFMSVDNIKFLVGDAKLVMGS